MRVSEGVTPEFAKECPFRDSIYHLGQLVRDDVAKRPDADSRDRSTSEFLSGRLVPPVFFFLGLPRSCFGPLCVVYSAPVDRRHTGFIGTMIQGEIQWGAHPQQPQPQYVQHALVGIIRQLAQFTASALEITVSLSAKIPRQDVTVT